MADDPQQEAAPSNPDPTPQAIDPFYYVPPTQESFGPAFPEAPNNASAPYASAASSPFGQRAQPEQEPFYAFQPQPAYGYAIPPQGFYGPPPYGFRAPASAPLPLWEAIRHLPRQYWRVLTHPKAATFVEEQGKAAWNIVWIQLLILGIIQSLSILLLVFLEFFLLQAIAPSNSLPLFSQILPITAIVIVVGYLALVPLSFFIGSGILHLVAKAFGGQSTFLAYAYNYALIVMPISVLVILLSIIPCIGSFAGSAGWVYEIVLLIFMTMGVQRLSGGKATAVVLIPVGAGILLVVAIYVAYFVFIFSLISTIPHS